MLGDATCPLDNPKKSSEAKASGGEPPPVDVAKELFDVGVRLLTSQNHSEKAARTFLGKCRKDMNDDAALLTILLNGAGTAVDAAGYIRGAVKLATKPKESVNDQLARFGQPD